MRGSRSPEKLKPWQAKAGKKALIGTLQEAAKYGNVIILAVKGTAASSAIQACQSANLNSKTVIDVTNPVLDVPPVHGVVKFFTEMNHSLMEQLQVLEPGARFVKAFSCVGKDLMFRPKFGGVRPTMFICGNDAHSKIQVSQILHQFGWESEDMGPAEAARAIEPLCMLWCIPGMRNNEWGHAFKLLKKGASLIAKKSAAVSTQSRKAKKGKSKAKKKKASKR
jgi:predicted dinucleotide-binding enzyme